MEQPYYEILKEVEVRLKVLEASHPPGPCESQEEREMVHRWTELQRYEIALKMSLTVKIVDLLPHKEPADMRLNWCIAHTVFCNTPYCCLEENFA